MGELVDIRSGVSAVVKTTDVDDILDEFYLAGNTEKKHKSPTKRLINHKNSTTIHK